MAVVEEEETNDGDRICVIVELCSLTTVPFYAASGEVTMRKVWDEGYRSYGTKVILY